MEQPNIAAAPAANAQGTPPDVLDDQFMESLIGSPNAQPVSPATGSNQAPQAPEDKSRERFEYWQGQADRYRQELEKVQPVATEYGRYAPVIEYLKQNPDALDTISQMKAKPAGAPATLSAPIKPNAPSNYNEQDAMTPGTESFKYRMAVDDYRTQLTEYMYAKQELQEKRQQELVQMEQQKNVEMQRISELGNTLVAQYGFNKDQVADFVQVMNSPESMEMANLVNLYKVIKHKTKNVADARRSVAPNGNIPPPPIGSGGMGEVQPTEEESFFGDIASFGKPSNPLMSLRQPR